MTYARAILCSANGSYSENLPPFGEYTSNYFSNLSFMFYVCEDGNYVPCIINEEGANLDTYNIQLVSSSNEDRAIVENVSVKDLKPVIFQSSSSIIFHF